MPPHAGDAFSVPCPCCGALLTIDPLTQSVIGHELPHKHAPITDLTAEIARLRTAGAEREKAFEQSMAAERNREQRMDRQFDELLRKAKERDGDGPAIGPAIKDIDL